MDWTDDNVIRLINEYRERQCLWDPATPHYKMMNKKNDAWTDIANTLGCDVEEVKKKMNSLLASFRRERAKERKKRFASGSDEVVRTSTWFAFRHLSFLLDKFTSRDTNKSTENLQEDPYFQEDYGILETALKKEDLSSVEDGGGSVNIEYTDSNAGNVSTTPFTDGSVRLRAADRKRTANTIALHKTLCKLQRLSDFRNEDDEFDLFGKSIAVQLRNMPLERALICQETLQAVMKQERLYQLNHRLS